MIRANRFARITRATKILGIFRFGSETTIFVCSCTCALFAGILLDMHLQLSEFWESFCPFWDFPDFSGIFPIYSGMVRGFPDSSLFRFLGLLRAPMRNSPERVRDTIWTFLEKF